ncbi:MAG TPA: DUF423 domain-containing protein [Opitutaceae bacterium]|nr:DUF423 domain-containing protein [Opitutaceae bacterium]
MRKRVNILFIAGLAGATGVGLGAFGAHALKETLLSRGTRDLWETGVTYHLVHAAALLAAAVWNERTPSVARDWAARCWAVGVLFFSGSLYALALGAPVKYLWPVTPLGGLALLAGWGCVIVQALRPPPPESGS